MSEPEVMLWSRLRGRSGDKLTFRRQHPFGSMILDFYCPSACLAVEVDGSTHWDDDARARDATKDAWLAQQGVMVVRIPVSAIFRDVDAVADGVILLAEERRAAEAPRTRPAPSTPLFASLGGRSPSRRFAGEVITSASSRHRRACNTGPAGSGAGRR